VTVNGINRRPAMRRRKKKKVGFARKGYCVYRHQKRRAQEARQDLDYDLDALRDLVRRRLGATCPGCRTPLTLDNLSLDHETPVSRNGGHTLDNLTVLCKNCNPAKGPLTAREWTELLATMNAWPPDIRKNLLARLKAGRRFARMVVR
jgi:5-methylcytosine-specific restriction endonuclease McrA